MLLLFAYATIDAADAADVSRRACYHASPRRRRAAYDAVTLLILRHYMPSCH